MIKIIDKVVEPSRIETGSFFKLKIKIEDDDLYKKTLITENGLKVITESNDIIRTEWGK